MKVSILIPVFDEADTVAELLDRVWAQPTPGIAREILVIESNSSDGSRALVAQFVQRHAADPATRVRLICQSRAAGKGHAIREGLAAATGDIVLIQDADLEYDVADYPRLLEPIVDGRADLVIGSRHLGPNRWHIRKFARKRLQSIVMNLGGMLFHWFFNRVYGVRLTDPTSMYKVFRADCLQGLSFSCNRFDFDFELLGSLLRAGFTPLEVPVAYSSRGFDQGKKIRPLRDPLSWVFTILRCRFIEPTAVIRRAARRRRTSAPSPASTPPGRSPAAAACSRSLR